MAQLESPMGGIEPTPQSPTLKRKSTSDAKEEEGKRQRTETKPDQSDLDPAYMALLFVEAADKGTECWNAGPDDGDETNGHIDQSSDGAANGHIDQSHDGITNGDINQSSDGITNGHTDKSSNATTIGHTDQSSDAITNGHTDQSSDAITNGHTDQSSDATTVGHTDQSSDDPTNGHTVDPEMDMRIKSLPFLESHVSC